LGVGETACPRNAGIYKGGLDFMECSLVKLWDMGWPRPDFPLPLKKMLLLMTGYNPFQNLSSFLIYFPTGLSQSGSVMALFLVPIPSLIRGGLFCRFDYGWEESLVWEF